ncbi:hypothetical protein JVT61DRAFT_7725 [Boletus reticuloceps]|uniref:Phospholipid/glycerol acyltransferase domain-containing protein n=1 Tax=Boletus reticuloceps TaxID=495285 RepID=A0A8I2YI44_9AGAM|nr:hypothetical protein JVT61DRAFT_7725 [Boletus reticuloceps]
MPKGSPTSWSYILVRLLFHFVLKIFYGTIVVENIEYIPTTGEPCIVCSNHPNSLTDALYVMRNMLRLTAKSTQFGRKTFTSWLIESAGTVPIKRRKDFPEGDTDNSEVMEKLIQALEAGDAVCLFPEGGSRYHPTIAPLKTGVARLLSDVLTRNRNNPDFSISILTCSLTYMHRQHFRSDVLVTFNPPMKFTPKDNPEFLAPVNFASIRDVTSRMHQMISSQTIDAPSWDLIRSAKLAARIYVPLGTSMSLGDFVRVMRTFVEAFKLSKAKGEKYDQQNQEDDDINRLRNDLKKYQDNLVYWGIKDDRIRRPLRRRTIISRIFVRLIWSFCLMSISLPGLVLWTPVFVTTFIGVRNFKKSGPTWDTWDEIAQYKLVYGLISGVIVWISSVLLTLPFAVITVILVPALMWMTLRWLEDAVSAFRAFTALLRLLWVGPMTLKELRETRDDLHSRIMNVAVGTLGLPQNPEKYFLESGGREKGRVKSKWESGAKYFSMRRRRKRDWNETLRLYDKVDYPDEGL